jgi:hypothetical protein
MSHADVEPLFVTIISARYGGAYEPGASAGIPQEIRRC